MDAAGVWLEQRLERLLMSGLQGAFSVGALLGALLGSLLLGRFSPLSLGEAVEAAYFTQANGP